MVFYKTRSLERTTIRVNVSDKYTKRKMETLTQKWSSNWLAAIPIKGLGYELIKQEFWDAIGIQYDWSLDGVMFQCVCKASFDVTHALSCKKCGFITLRWNEVRGIKTELLNKICIDVRRKPILLELNNEDLPLQANSSQKIRLGISSLNFWSKTIFWNKNI